MTGCQRVCLPKKKIDRPLTQSVCNDTSLRMEQHQLIREIEATAKLAGAHMKDVCARADIHQTTVSKWKAQDGPKATYEGLMKLRRAADELLAEKERAL